MAYSQGMSVNSFETVSDIRSLSLGSATAQEATSWRTDGLSALLVTFYPAPFPCFAIRSTSYWDFTATGGLAFDCYNPASIPVTLGIRAEDQAGIASTREIALQPNKASYIRLTYQSETTPDPLVYGVRTLPSPFSGTAILSVLQCRRVQSGSHRTHSLLSALPWQRHFAPVRQCTFAVILLDEPAPYRLLRSVWSVHQAIMAGQT